MSFLNTVLAVLHKELLIELKTREIIVSTALFALLVVLLSAFAFGLNVLPGADASAGVLWIAIAFSGILALNRTFARERDFNVWTSVLLTPAPRAALYIGKALGVFVYLMIVELILLPVIELFFHAPMLGNFGAVLLVLVIGTLGYAGVGTLFAAMTIRTRLKDLLLGVVLFPLISPVLIMAVKATVLIVGGGGLAAAADYLKFLIVIDIVYFVGGFWLFGSLMEDRASRRLCRWFVHLKKACYP